MRTGKRRSAEVIISRGLPGILGSSFVLVGEPSHLEVHNPSRQRPAK